MVLTTVNEVIGVLNDPTIAEDSDASARLRQIVDSANRRVRKSAKYNGGTDSVVTQTFRWPKPESVLILESDNPSDIVVTIDKLESTDFEDLGEGRLRLGIRYQAREIKVKYNTGDTVNQDLAEAARMLAAAWWNQTPRELWGAKSESTGPNSIQFNESVIPGRVKSLISSGSRRKRAGIF